MTEFRCRECSASRALTGLTSTCGVVRDVNPRVAGYLRWPGQSPTAELRQNLSRSRNQWFARIPRPETDRPTLLAAVLNRLPGNAGTGGTRVPEDPPPVTTRQRPKILPPLVFRIFALELSFYSWVRLGPETRQITRNLNWAIVRRQHLND